MPKDSGAIAGAPDQIPLDSAIAASSANGDWRDLRDVTVALAWFLSFPVLGLATPSLVASSSAMVAVGMVGVMWVISALWTPFWGPVVSAIPLAGVVVFFLSLLSGELLAGYDRTPHASAETVLGVVVVLALVAAGAGAISTATGRGVRRAAGAVHIASGAVLLLLVIIVASTAG